MIVDCFLYNGEREIVRWRLRELDPVVDRFVLVEATRTFSGSPRRLLFDPSDPLFAPYAGKIAPVVCDDLPDYPVGTSRMYETESIQRNAIAPAISDCGPDDLVMMSDADEIPRRSAVEALAERFARARRLGSPRPLWCAIFEATCHYYWLDLVSPIWTPWLGTHIAAGDVVNRLGGHWLRMNNHDARRIPRAGWHFSFFHSPAEHAAKLADWSHIEFNRPPMNDPAWLDARRRAGLDWDLTREAPLIWTPLALDSAPDFVLADPETLRRFVGRPDLHLTPGGYPRMIV